MAFSSSVGGAVDAINSLSPQAQRDRNWQKSARGMETAKFASQMKANKIANEKAAREEKVSGSYQQMKETESAFKELGALDPIKDADRIATIEAGMSEEVRAGVGQLKANPQSIDSLIARRIAAGDLGTEMGILDVDAKSNIGDLAQDFRNGLITAETFDSGIRGLKQGTSEFERLLADSPMKESEKVAIRGLRLKSMLDGNNGFMITSDGSGGMTISEGMSNSALTASAQSKVQKEFTDKSVAADEFMFVSNKFIEDAIQAPTAGGFAGTIASLGNEFTSAMKNTAKLLGVGDADGKLTEDGAVGRVLTDDSLWGDQANLNQVQRGRILDMAIAYSGIKGQTGKALSDADLKRALEQVGAGTNNPMSIVSKLADIQENVDASLRIGAHHHNLEYDGLLNYDTKYKHYNRDGMEEGDTFVTFKDGIKYYRDTEGAIRVYDPLSGVK